ncbi:hypothetical protein [Natronolimnohabitans innermongolicus]|uniref:Uncharacterized protein n=1 Tax=Natronolimnohabitans innermongolicus JCM 12255 TaxID=1227499 RepID=L9X1M0_9EURY|nr:hypothetical protein [Natronolimnohabitans innermongolicus]ELY54483.1 hypothetical protein C493_12499 [Natronolimnohabitans innermongolicus JCM 12255]
MTSGRAGDPDRDVVVCADVLGSFGVTPDDVRAQRREYRTTIPPGQEDRSLESVLADVLADARDRTATVRRLICRSDRGLTCSARYAQRALGRELEAVFASVDWSLEWTRTGPAANGRDRLELAATDPKGRRRETTVTYPETPLADDNLPAVLRAVDERLLAGTDATLVLLSAGTDRWRAALVEADELETLRDRYGERLAAFDRPLLPEYGLEAYAPDDGTSVTGRDSGASRSDGASTAVRADDDGPWPQWAVERADRRSNVLEYRVSTDDGSVDGDGDAAPSDDGGDSATVASLIDEAEPESGGGNESEAGGFRLQGGSPTVSRVSDDGSVDASPRDAAASILEDERERAASRDEPNDTDAGSDDADDDPEDDGFGTLTGTTKTTRVTNDSFGTGEEFATENDRYRALGAALGAGGAVSVEGLLEDDEFLPELPASGPSETRIEFEEPFDPAETTTAASAERDGFEWVDAGELETTRLSGGGRSRRD